nr:hypothetical protein [Tanacetum cinerariifolium]
NASNDEPQPSSDAGHKDDEGVSKESKIDNQEKSENNTHDVNTAGPSINTASTNDNIEMDMRNITTTYQVPTTLNTRILKDHSLDHVISDVQSGVLTRSKLKPTNEQGFIGAIYEGKTYEDLNTCLIEEEVYVCQPPGFEDPDHPDKVYVDDIIFGSTKKDLCTEFKRLMKDRFQMSSMGELTLFLGLQVKQKEDGIFISQDKYVNRVLRKFNFSDVKSASTPVDMEKTLVKDADGDDVDVHLYRFMIRSLMYLTTSRPDIILISWQCKKQTVVSTSTTEAEYVATASCCGQVL